MGASRRTIAPSRRPCHRRARRQPPVGEPACGRARPADRPGVPLFHLPAAAEATVARAYHAVGPGFGGMAPQSGGGQPATGAPPLRLPILSNRCSKSGAVGLSGFHGTGDFRWRRRHNPAPLTRRRPRILPSRFLHRGQPNYSGGNAAVECRETERHPEPSSRR